MGTLLKERSNKMAVGSAATSFALICVIGNKSELAEFDHMAVQYLAFSIPFSLSTYFSTDKDTGLVEVLAYLIGLGTFLPGFYLFLRSIDQFGANLFLAALPAAAVVLGLTNTSDPQKRAEEDEADHVRD